MSGGGLRTGVAVAVMAACGGAPQDGDGSPGARPATRAESVPVAASDDSASRAAAGEAARQPADSSGAKAAPAGPPAAPSPARSARADSVRGRVAVVGAEPATQVIVRLPAGASVRLIGPAAAAIGRASGAEVVAWGARRDPRTLEVSSYAIRSVDGVPAIDGTLAESDGGLVLVGPDGARRRIVSPPAALRAHVGARVWISGAPDREPQAFGVLEPKG